MKLSEMTTEKSCDVLCDLIEPISNIAEDKKIINAIKVLSDEFKKEDKTVQEVGITFIKKVLPELLKTHKKDTFIIIGCLCNKKEEEISKQKITQTIKDIKDSLDEDLLDFFKSSTITDQVE